MFEKPCRCLAEYVLKMITITLRRIIMEILGRIIVTLCKSRAHMAEQKFPAYLLGTETTNQLKLNQVNSSQRLVFVERRKPGDKHLSQNRVDNQQTGLSSVTKSAVNRSQDFFVDDECSCHAAHVLSI